MKLLITCLVSGAVLAACAPSTLPSSPSASGVSAKKDSVLRIARATAAAGDLDTAANLYSQALAQDEDDLSLRLELASILTKIGRGREARDLLEEARKQAPDNKDVIEGLAESYIYIGLPQEAAALAEEMIKKAPEAKFFALQGVALDMQDEHAAAQDVYREGLKAFKGDDVLQTNLGMSLILSNDYDKAIKVLSEVAEGRNSFPKARQNLALAYGLKGNWNKAYALGLRDLTREQAKENIEFYKQFVLSGTKTVPVSTQDLPPVLPEGKKVIIPPDMEEDRSPRIKPPVRFDSSTDFVP